MNKTFNIIITNYYKYKTPILYIFFGAITTVVNFAAFFLADTLFLKILSVEESPGWTLVISTAIAWIVSVGVAFMSNKIFVFESKGFSRRTLTNELIPFVTARLLTYFLDTIIIVVGVDYMHFNKLIVKICANIVVLILNYIASKLFIFRKK